MSSQHQASSTSSSGLTFVDNSELSVCEKIKLYFARNNHNPIPQQYPPYVSLDSSTSSQEADFDASFKQILEEAKRRKQVQKRNNKKMNLNETNIESMQLLMDETTIDLCSSPEDHVRSRTGLRVEASPNLTIYNGNLFGEHCRRGVDSLCHEDGGDDSDDSLGVAELDDSLATPTKVKNDEKSKPWYLELSASDISFLEHEQECKSPSPKKSTQIPDLRINLNETQLFDVEEPSELWDQSVLFSMNPANAFRSRPSTIPEESTINSSSSSIASKSKSSEVSQTSILHEVQKPNPRKYRQSAVNVFPKQKARPFLETYSESSENNSIASPFDSPKSHNTSSKRNDKPISPKPCEPTFVPRNIVLQPKILSPARPKPPLAPKSVYYATTPNHTTDKSKTNNKPTKQSNVNDASQRRKSLHLINFDDTMAVDENSFHDNSDDDHEDDLNQARQFNDTIEAMDFYMAEGKKLIGSAVKQQPPQPISPSKNAQYKFNYTPSPPKPSQSPKATTSSVPFSPKTTRTPDTIRRRILMRNLLRNSVQKDVSSPTAQGSNSAASPGYQFSKEEMQVRRSIQKGSLDDSFL